MYATAKQCNHHLPNPKMHVQINTKTTMTSSIDLLPLFVPHHPFFSTIVASTSCALNSNDGLGADPSSAHITNTGCIDQVQQIRANCHQQRNTRLLGWSFKPPPAPSLCRRQTRQRVLLHAQQPSPSSAVQEPSKVPDKINATLFSLVTAHNMRCCTAFFSSHNPELFAFSSFSPKPSNPAVRWAIFHMVDCRFAKEVLLHPSSYADVKVRLTVLLWCFIFADSKSNNMPILLRLRTQVSPNYKDKHGEVSVSSWFANQKIICATNQN